MTEEERERLLAAYHNLVMARKSRLMTELERPRLASPVPFL